MYFDIYIFHYSVSDTNYSNNAHIFTNRGDHELTSTEKNTVDSFEISDHGHLQMTAHIFNSQQKIGVRTGNNPFLDRSLLNLFAIFVIFVRNNSSGKFCKIYSNCNLLFCNSGMMIQTILIMKNINMENCLQSKQMPQYKIVIKLCPIT